MSGLVSRVCEKQALTFQELLFTLQRFFAGRPDDDGTFGPSRTPEFGTRKPMTKPQ
jgi:hypothetical protein